MSPRGTSLPITNNILAKLPSELLAHLMSKFTEVDLPVGAILISSNRPIEHAYFPLRGMISLVKLLQDGSMVEVGLVGKEGFTGVPLALGETTDAIDSQVQIAGAGLRISALAFREELNRSPAFLSSLLRFANALTAQIAQTAACTVTLTMRQNGTARVVVDKVVESYAEVETVARAFAAQQGYPWYRVAMVSK